MRGLPDGFENRLRVPGRDAQEDTRGARRLATTTFLRYELELGLRTDPDMGGPLIEQGQAGG